MQSPGPVLAAGGVVWRTTPSKSAAIEILVIHRPKYDDWTFPKGKRDRGEALPVTAVREVEEETGVRIRLGIPLRTHAYDIRRPEPGIKHVTYWVGQPVGGDDAADYVPNREVDKVRWIGLDKVASRLTHDRDRDVLEDFDKARKSGRHDTRTLIVLRHAHARVRKHWKRDDLERPLTAAGRTEAQRMTPLLGAYGITRVVSSEAVRCKETVAPYVDAAGLGLIEDGRLNEPESDEKLDGLVVRKAVDKALRKRAVVACSHRLVLPSMFDALDEPEVRLRPAEMIVVHHHDSQVRATERHPG